MFEFGIGTMVIIGIRPDLDLEFPLHHQGMGTRRRPAAGPNDSTGQGRRREPRLLADRDAVSACRIDTLDVPPQDIITRDNVSVKVNAVCYFR